MVRLGFRPASSARENGFVGKRPAGWPWSAAASEKPSGGFTLPVNSCAARGYPGWVFGDGGVVDMLRITRGRGVESAAPARG